MFSQVKVGIGYQPLPPPSPFGEGGGRLMSLLIFITETVEKCIGSSPKGETGKDWNYRQRVTKEKLKQTQPISSSGIPHFRKLQLGLDIKSTDGETD